jgi:hypothetical protein
MSGSLEAVKVKVLLMEFDRDVHGGSFLTLNAIFVDFLRSDFYRVFTMKFVVSRRVFLKKKWPKIIFFKLYGAAAETPRPWYFSQK